MSSTERLPIEHVLRPSPPWRDEAKTECGRPLNDLSGVLTREQLAYKVARLGQQRSQLTTCITCWNTAARWKPWDVSPSDVMARVTQDGMYGRDTEVADRELRAIAALIEAHREEFDSLLNALQNVESISDLRRRRAAGRRLP